MTWYWIVLIVLASFIVASITLIINERFDRVRGNEESSLLSSLIWPVNLVIAVVAGILGAVIAIVVNILGLIKLGIDKLK